MTYIKKMKFLRFQNINNCNVIQWNRTNFERYKLNLDYLFESCYIFTIFKYMLYYDIVNFVKILKNFTACEYI